MQHACNDVLTVYPKAVKSFDCASRARWSGVTFAKISSAERCSRSCSGVMGIGADMDVVDEERIHRDGTVVAVGRSAAGRSWVVRTGDATFIFSPYRTCGLTGG